MRNGRLASVIVLGLAPALCATSWAAETTPQAAESQAQTGAARPSQGPGVPSHYRIGSVADVRASVLAAAQRREALQFGHDGRKDAWGTGVVVSRTKNGREGLVLTAAHLLPSDLAAAHVRLDGKRVPVTGVVAFDAQCDYALVEVKLPKPSIKERVGNFFRRLTGRTPRGPVLPEPAKVAYATEMAPGEQAYVCGYAPRGGAAPAAAIRFGTNLTGTVETIRTDGGNKVPSWLMSYTSGMGFSGAPVFSSRSGEVVAIHHANNFFQMEGREFEVSFCLPTGFVLQDLASKLESGQVNRRYRRKVTDFLRTVADDTPAGIGATASIQPSASEASREGTLRSTARKLAATARRCWDSVFGRGGAADAVSQTGASSTITPAP